MKLRKIPKNRPVLGKDLDRLIDKINAQANITGSGGISVATTKNGTAIRTNSALTALEIRRAITTQAAPAATYITANLYNKKGTEVTTGNEAAINVHCSVIGDVNLNAAVPRLANNDDIFVAKLPYSSASTIVRRWYCVSLFQKSQDCD